VVILRRSRRWIMPSDVVYAVQEEQPSPPRRGTVVALAIMDITGVLVTVGAAAILTLNDETDRRWWWAVGLAFLSDVVAVVLLVRIADRRRSFIEASLRLAADLEARVQHDMPIPRDLFELGQERRRAALASGDIAIADRLAMVLGVPRL
jgi:hypothetical protein